jgi:glycosyltransferase involved in cell wall biosynthesis
MRACAVVPAFQAERSVGDVVRSLVAVWPFDDAIFVVDDGSTDRTAEIARAAGARVVSHGKNRGKGAALRTGLDAAKLAGFDLAVSVDADGQHPADQAVRLLTVEPDADALVLGVRDLVGARAPRANQISNRISNFFLSMFSGRPLADTQCGLRRYPVELTLDLDGRDPGYAFEAEIILRAIAAGVRVVEAPIDVYYPPEDQRVSHFHSVRDPMRIVARVVRTLVATGGMRHAPPVRARPRSREVDDAAAAFSEQRSPVARTTSRDVDASA